MSTEDLRVPHEQLSIICDPNDLGFETTDELTPLEGTIGQERAISALELGLEIDEPGFNIFISGPPGSGRNTAIRAYVDGIATEKAVPPDWGYVHNFEDPSQPIAISLPCGMMRNLRRDMDELVDTCRREIPRAFESDAYTHRMEEAMKNVQAQTKAITEDMNRRALEAGFALRSTPSGVTPVAVKDGRPLTMEEYDSLSEAEREQMTEQGDELQHTIGHTTAELRRLNKSAAEQAREVDRETVRFTLSPIIAELKEAYSEFPQVVSYLVQVESDMAEHYEILKPEEQAPQPPLPGMPGVRSDEDVFTKYRVNDLVDNTTCQGAPVVFEHSPTYYNLFGRVEYKARIGTFNTDLTMIKCGSLHRANGGYLIVQARDLLSSPLSWETL